ncbi:MAG: hypothetical protein ACLUF5_04105 [Clostridia bacterium]|jgi:FtsH-binding integral membrane protein|nr:hypothetical protein [Bacilli bacterium]
MEFLKNNAKWIGLAGCALMIIGCFLPFATVSILGLSETIALSGTGALGIILIITAIISGIVMLTKKSKLSLITTIIYALFVVLNIANASEYGDAFSYGIGLYVVIIGVIIAVVMPFFKSKQDK